ncbi:MAG: DUF502 domain-containing protein [Planctomycetota bacterium]
MKKLLSYFLKGLLFVVPFAVTIYVVYIIFIKIDGLLHIPIPGIGFIATLILITFVGFLTSIIITKRLLNMMDKVFNQLPFVKLLYSSIKDLMKAFVGNKKIFDKPVLLTLSLGSARDKWNGESAEPSSDSNIRVLGFITRDDLDSLGIKDSVAVYLPQAYNFAGNLLIVHRSQITPVNKNGSEVMAFIISAGITEGHK